MRASLVFLLFAAQAFAEVHTMTLRQALDRALEQNPDVVLARLDQRRSQSEVALAKEPYSPKLAAGSGLAGTYGFPASLNGNAPSIFQVQGRMTLYDKPQSYRVAQATEATRGLEIDTTLRQQDVAYRVYSAFLDAEQAARSADAARTQVQNLERVKQQVEFLVAEELERPLASRRAAQDVRTAGNLVNQFAAAQTNTEITLAQILGLPAGDQVRPALEDRAALAVPVEDQVIANAIAQSDEIRRLESSVAAKRLEIRSHEAERLPKINAFSTYQVLSRINNYDVFYGRFQRHNFQIGLSIELPILTGTGPKTSIAIAQTDIDRLMVEINRTRSRISADLRTAYVNARLAESSFEVTREDLAIAREEVTLLLERAADQRATTSQVEAARAAEQAKWVTYYDAQHTMELARLNVLRTSGTLLAAVR